MTIKYTVIRQEQVLDLNTWIKVQVSAYNFLNYKQKYFSKTKNS